VSINHGLQPLECNAARYKQRGLAAMGNNLSCSAVPEESIEHPPKMPNRHTTLEFYIDTNRINARQGLPHMNQLEKWRRNGVISIQMPDEARLEALRGRNPDRSRKTKSYICSIVPQDMQARYQRVLDEVENILFPSGAQTQDQLNDVGIVFNAGYYMAILITDDGDSNRQPNGILGSREKLLKLGIQVMRDSEAVSLVRERIGQRDELARAVASRTGQPLPEWVGVD